MRFVNLFITIAVIIASIFRIDLGYGMNPLKTKAIDLDKYELVWNDEFDGTQVDTDKWNTSQVNDLIQSSFIRRGGYWHQDMLEVFDGNLHIKTKYVDEETAAEYGDGYKAGWYTGYVTTYNSYPENKSEPDEFLYGYYETRCILPKGYGLWSAFWMMNFGVYNEENEGKDGTEIDIFEGTYYNLAPKITTDRVSMNLHWNGYADKHEHIGVGEYFVENPYEQYNTYGLLWTPDYYVFYINGHECARTNKGGVSENPESLILSVEIEGKDGIIDPEGYYGDIRNNTETPDFVIDYVRVYKAK